MCGGGGAPSISVPKAPPALPQIVAPIEANTEAKVAGDEERRRRAAASGRSDTILTSGLGLMSQAITGGGKTRLGGAQ